MDTLFLPVGNNLNPLKHSLCWVFGLNFFSRDTSTYVFHVNVRFKCVLNFCKDAYLCMYPVLCLQNYVLYIYIACVFSCSWSYIITTFRKNVFVMTSNPKNVHQPVTVFFFFSLSAFAALIFNICCFVSLAHFTS